MYVYSCMYVYMYMFLCMHMQHVCMCICSWGVSRQHVNTEPQDPRDQVPGSHPYPGPGSNRNGRTAAGSVPATRHTRYAICTARMGS